MAAHVSMTHSLIILLLVMRCLSCTDAKMQVTRRQLKEIDRQLKKLNKPAVKSIESPDGDIIDCVHISHQPAFDHPLLKNHTIQMRPSFNPFGVDDEDEVASEKETDSIDQPWRRYGQCPDDTIPIRRIKRDDLLRAGSAEGFSRLSHRTVPYLIRSDAKFRHREALVMTNRGVYHGANAVMNVWRPNVEKEESSSSFVTVAGGFDNDVNLIEAGWMVSPALYGDNNARLTITWSRDTSLSTGCYNLLCSGFVQTNNQVALGGSIEPVSTYGGRQYEAKIMIRQDPESRDWWFHFQEYEPVGYFPNSIFTSLGGGASNVFWGGMVKRKDTFLIGPYTTTMMGSGHFSGEAFKKASYFRQIQYLDSNYGLQRATELQTTCDDCNCYDTTLGGYDNSFWGVFMYYGGPGRNPKCP